MENLAAVPRPPVGRPISTQDVGSVVALRVKVSVISWALLGLGSKWIVVGLDTWLVVGRRWTSSVESDGLGPTWKIGYSRRRHFCVRRSAEVVFLLVTG